LASPSEYGRSHRGGQQEFEPLYPICFAHKNTFQPKQPDNPRRWYSHFLFLLVVNPGPDWSGPYRITAPKSVGRQGLSDTRRGIPRWPGAMALLSIGASYPALPDYVTVVPRFWLPGLMALVVVIVLVAWAVDTL
jgi:hypothetical protein